MKQLLSLMLSVLVAAPGCASTMAHQTAGARVREKPPAVDPMLMADFIRQLPIGSRVKITQADGKVIRAVLMKHDADPIVVQQRTRIPEAPIEVRVSDILAVELETPGNAGRHVAIVVAAAAGTTLGVLLLLAALLGD